MFRLAWGAGGEAIRNPYAFADSIDGELLEDWLAYLQYDGIGQDWYRTGQVATEVNHLGNLVAIYMQVKDVKPKSLMDFIPFAQRPLANESEAEPMDKDKQIDQQQRQVAQAMPQAK